MPDDQTCTMEVDLAKVPHLRGWPVNTLGLPTDTERRLIEAVQAEVAMNEPELDEQAPWRSWFIAGQTVARFRRDIGQLEVKP